MKKIIMSIVAVLLTINEAGALVLKQNNFHKDDNP